jgi:tellurite resistance protein TehA-like permease
MRWLEHAAVIAAFAVIASVIVFARPHPQGAAPTTSLPTAPLAVVQK